MNKNIEIICIPSPKYCLFNQCPGAGAGGAEIIWGPGAGADNKFK